MGLPILYLSLKAVTICALLKYKPQLNKHINKPLF